MTHSRIRLNVIYCSSGDVIYTILEKLGEGGFAKIYKIDIDDATKDFFKDHNKKVVKVNKCLSVSCF